MASKFDARPVSVRRPWRRMKSPLLGPRKPWVPSSWKYFRFGSFLGHLWLKGSGWRGSCHSISDWSESCSRQTYCGSEGALPCGCNLSQRNQGPHLDKIDEPILQHWDRWGELLLRYLELIIPELMRQVVFWDSNTIALIVSWFVGPVETKNRLEPR